MRRSFAFSSFYPGGHALRHEIFGLASRTVGRQEIKKAAPLWCCFWSIKSVGQIIRKCLMIRNWYSFLQNWYRNQAWSRGPESRLLSDWLFQEKFYRQYIETRQFRKTHLYLLAHPEPLQDRVRLIRLRSRRCVSAKLLFRWNRPLSAQ